MEEFSVFFYVAVILIGLPLLYAIRIAEPEHELILCITTAVAIAVFMILLYVVDDAMPFAGGGDDEGYFDASNLHPDSIETALGVIVFYQQQPGYSLLLMLVDVLVQGLYLKKAFNLMLFVMNALMWYRIGLLTTDRKTALRIFFGVLLATPLMFYFFFLLKDMAITVVQTALLLWTLQFILTERRIYLGLMVLAVILTALMRLPSILLDGAMVVGALFFYRSVWFERWRSGRLSQIVVAGMAIAAAAGIFILVTNAEFIQFLGIAGTRSFGGEGLSNQVDAYLAKAQGSPLFILPIFFLITLNGLYTLSRPIDPSIVEGLTALPWIYIGLPLFLWAGYYFANNWRTMATRERAFYLLLFFITLLFLGQSMIVYDTTRWRMPGLPAMVALSALGWVTMDKRRGVILASWAGGMSLLLTVYYVFVAGG